MYAVIVDDGFDSLYDTKEEAKTIARYFRIYQQQSAHIHKLTKEDKHILGIKE